MQEAIRDFYDEQFSRWPEVKERYLALGKTRRRILDVGGMEIIVQHNPGRIGSTAAKTDAASISERPCFLCAANRPPQQIAGTLLPGWDMLVNPYPIFPVHFTIASQRHEPQWAMPVAPMVTLVDAVPLLTAFYNGARSGASAPDHMHFQAVLKDEVPLLGKIEEIHPADGPAEMVIDSLPMKPVSYVVRPDDEGMQVLRNLAGVCGTDSHGTPDKGLSNSFVWKDARGFLRAVVFRRRSHRPACFYAEGDARIMVSPGALDMAGILILPREEDFNRITPEDICKVYEEV